MTGRCGGRARGAGVEDDVEVEGGVERGGAAGEGEAAWWRARAVMRVSMAEEAPREWPWKPLVPEMGMWAARGPKTWWSAAASTESLVGVAVPWALM